MTSVLERRRHAPEVRADGQGAHGPSCRGPANSAKTVSVHLLLSRPGPEDRAAVHAPRPPDNPRLVFSDSFPENVHHWFPCFDYPNDKVTNEIVATVKSGLKVAANGRLVSVIEDKAAGTVTYHWSQDLPALDLSHLPGGRALCRRPGFLQDPARELLGLSAGRGEGRADLREDPEDDRVLQQDLRLRLSLAEIRPGLGPAPAGGPRAPRPRP